MSLLKKLNIRASDTKETGLGSNSSLNAERFYQKNGKPNVEIKGVPLFEKHSSFRSLIDMSLWKFLFMVLVFYIALNTIFALIYVFIGVEHIGIDKSQNFINQFLLSFFFSTQTFTTVGYGNMNPTSFASNFVASIEALAGLLSFALASGLFYGRFSKPKAYIKFSYNALFSPYKEGYALMFRFVPYKNHHLTDVYVNATLAMQIEEQGVLKNKFFNLPLEINHVNALSLSWTLVHFVNDVSPLADLSLEDLKQAKAEVLVFVKAFDENFSSRVVSRTSYIVNEFIESAKFKNMYEPNSFNTKTILHINKLNEYEKASINFPK